MHGQQNIKILQIFQRNNYVSCSFKIFTLMLAAEGLVDNEEGDADQKQQQRGNAAVGTGNISASPRKSLSSAEEHSSSEGHSYGRYGFSSESSGLGSESIHHGNAGISSENSGFRGNGLSSGGFEINLRPEKIVLLTVKGLEHGSGHGGTALGSSGYSLGTGSIKGAEFGGDLRDEGTATGHVPLTTVTHELPGPVPQPVPVTVNSPIAVPVPAPYLLEVSRPVQVSIPHPLGVIVDRPYSVTITRPVPVPVPVPQPVPAPLPRPYFIAIPQPVRLQIPQPVAVPVPRPVAVALPHQLVVSSVSETDVGGLRPNSRGVYSSGTSYSTSAAAISESGRSGVARALEYFSGGNFAYKPNYGSSGLDLGQVSTPLKGVYVPSYLGGLHGSYGGPNGIQRSGYVEGHSADDDFAGRHLRAPGH